MEIILHRINKISELKSIDPSYGVEIDIRSFGDDLILSHDPFKEGDKLEDYLKKYKHGTLILNIKESGIENVVLSLVKKYKNIKDYFLLDVEFPFIFSSSRKKFKNVAVRFSEFESINTVRRLTGLVDWVWIDTFTKLPLNEETIDVLRNFKTCLVCPERWERPQDIACYKERIQRFELKPNAVMTSRKTIKEWM